MPSEKRVNKKKSRRRKGKKYSRSSEGKDEGKKSRDDKNHAEDQVSEIDICSYVNDSAELVSKIFTCLGESYIAEATPPIFKSLRQIELKKLCLRELAMLSNEAVIGIMHGIENKESLAKPSGIPSHQRNLRELIANAESQKKRHDTGRKETSSDSSSRSRLESSPDVASTSSHHAPISSHIPVIDNSAQISLFMDPEGRKSEDALEDVNISDISEGNVSPDENLQIEKLPEEHEVEQNDNRESLPKINLPFLQPVPEVTELEYRVRAIRSMIANIDKINEKSFERNSIQ